MALTIMYWMLAAYLVLGSVSIGYMFLRTGWPRVRILDAPYKLGWSLVIGMAFACVAVLGSLAVDFLIPGLLGASEMLLVFSAGCFSAAIPVLTARRRFFGARKLHVEVPKEVVGAKITAARVVDRLSVDKRFIDTSGLQLGKLREMREALAGAKAGAAAAVPAPAKGGAAEKPVPAAEPAEKAPEEKPKWMVEKLPEKPEKPMPGAAEKKFAEERFKKRLEEAAKKTAEEEAKAAEGERKKAEEAAKKAAWRAAGEKAMAGEEKKKMAVKEAKPAMAVGEAAKPKPPAKLPEKKPEKKKPPAVPKGPLKEEAEIGWEEAEGAKREEEELEARAVGEAKPIEKKEKGAEAAEEKKAAEKKEKEAAEKEPALGDEEKKRKVAEIMKKIKEMKETGEE